MDVQEKFELITRNLAEVLVEEDLRYFLDNNVKLKHYIGFEISGQVHLGSGLGSVLKIKDFIEAGVETSIFLADWHTWINDKLGGDMKVIQGVGVNYFKESFIACIKCVGGDPKKLNFVLGSELYHSNDRYWETVVEVAKNTTLARTQRSITIMGRKEGESVDFAKLMYPIMQVADIFAQDLTIAHAGMDQRKAHVVMRDVADKMAEHNNTVKEKKPVALHHHLLLGLGRPSKWPLTESDIDQDFWSDMKMSKSKPETAIFIHDKPDVIEKKINKAFCPEGETVFNPIMDWTKHLIFPIKQELNVERIEEHGGGKVYTEYGELEFDFQSKSLHPVDLKKAVAESLIDILAPARKHFTSGKNKKLLEEMLNLTVTR